MSQTIYSNNANIELCDPLPAMSSIPTMSLPDGAVENLTSVYDSIVYIALHIFDAPQWFIHAMLMARLLIRNTMDTYLDWYLDTKLDMLMNEHRVVRIIHLLHEALFTNRDPPRTDDDKRIRCEKTFMELKDFIPKLFVHVIGSQKHSDGTKLLFDFLQQPRLNKQLSYMLLDQVIMEVFPELADATGDSA